MTKEQYSSIRGILSTGMTVNPLMTNAYDVFDSILNTVVPLNNRMDLAVTKTLKAFLTSFDYRSSTFQKDVDTLCANMRNVTMQFAKSGDIPFIAMVAILIYAKNTDINKKSVNILINDIVSMKPDNFEESQASEMMMTIALLSSNVVGQKSLELETKSLMNKLTSSFSNFLGVGCVSGSSVNANTVVPKCYMRSPKELGIDVSMFQQMNQCIIQGKGVLANEVAVLVNALCIDTKYIDVSKCSPSIYDIINIRFCWSFYQIFQWVMSISDKKKAEHVLNVVVRCLLETSEKFKELDFIYLTFVEVISNALQILLSDGLCSDAYYPNIRAKNLSHALVSHRIVVTQEVWDAIYEKVRNLQLNVLYSIKKYTGSNNQRQKSLLYSSWQTIPLMERYIGSDYDRCEMEMRTQLLETVKLLKEECTTIGAEGIMELLGTNAELSTILDAQQFSLFNPFRTL